MLSSLIIFHQGFRHRATSATPLQTFKFVKESQMARDELVTNSIMLKSIMELVTSSSRGYHPSR